MDHSYQLRSATPGNHSATWGDRCSDDCLTQPDAGRPASPDHDGDDVPAPVADEHPDIYPGGRRGHTRHRYVRRGNALTHAHRATHLHPSTVAATRRRRKVVAAASRPLVRGDVDR